MELKRIKNNTHWIRGGTNTGVYIFEDNTALLIDVGLGGERQDKLLSILKENRIKVSYIINTHEHEDHIGGNYQIKKEFPELKIYASKRGKVFIENPDIYLDYLTGGRRSNILVEEVNKYLINSESVDYVVKPGDILKLKGHDFKIIECSGHTEGGIGVLTDDGVVFLGDLLITENSLKKFDFLFMSDFASQIWSLDNIRNIDFDIAILGHSSGIYSKEETLSIASYNYKALYRILEFLLNSIDKAKTFDELIKDFVDKRYLVKNYIAYIEYRNSLNAALAYLLDADVITYTLEDNTLKYKLRNLDEIKN